jgi:Domain of unknown function (DUF4105)
MIRTALRTLLVVVSTAMASAAGAQARPARPAAPVVNTHTDPLHQAGRDVTISLLTMGNGTQVWELFGHNAIWIHDLATNRDTVFNWGVFNFRQPRFIQRFLKGTMLYSMGGDSMENILYEYRVWNRTVLAQELDLTAPQKDSILAAIRLNALPENIDYRYDYFRDNCSTRVRDILDNALGGPLRKEAAVLTGRTYRWHALRLMQLQPAIMLGVDIGLGRPSDVNLSKWQEMFLPRQLHDFVSNTRVADSAGNMHPLVKRETVLFQSTRPPEPDAPPKFGNWALLGGIAVAALLTWLGIAAINRGDWTRFVAGTVFALWSLAAGLLGTVLVLLWGVTDHVFAHQNENLLIFNPLWLLLAVLAPVYVISGRAGGAARMVARTIGALATIALLLHLVGLSSQTNLAIIALGLPPALAVAAVTGRRPTTASQRLAALR